MRHRPSTVELEQNMRQGYSEKFFEEQEARLRLRQLCALGLLFGALVGGVITVLLSRFFGTPVAQIVGGIFLWLFWTATGGVVGGCVAVRLWGEHL